jgi:hypothetical protein
MPVDAPVFPRRPRGTSSRSLSAWQAIAQLVPLVPAPNEPDLCPSCFAVRLPACPFTLQATAPLLHTASQKSETPELSLRRLCEARVFLFSVFDKARFLRGRLSLLTVCRLLLRHLFQAFLFPLSRGVLFPATKGMGSRQRPGLPDNAPSFAVMPHARRK